jgi:hypothetical protein
MHALVAPNRSAFIKGRATHGNFRAVQSTAKLLHVRRRPTVLLKIDVAEAFRYGKLGLSPRAPLSYGIFQTLGQLGFHPFVYSSRSLSSLLFVICMEAICVKATPFFPSVCDLHGGSKLLGCASRSSGSVHSAPVAKYSTPFVALRGRSGHLVAPADQDLLLLRAMLAIFAAASGLHTNISKCQFTPIRCTQEQIGSGISALFWSDRWLDGEAIPQLAPDLVQAVRGSVRKTRTVAQALQNASWISDISGSLSLLLP